MQSCGIETVGLRRLSVTLALALAASGIAFQAAEAFDRRVRIVNDSRVDMVGFYGVRVGVRDWHESLLGDDVLPAGRAIVLNFEDGSGYCRYRFRAVFEDGLELERPSINICQVGTYRYTD